MAGDLDGDDFDELLQWIWADDGSRGLRIHHGGSEVLTVGASELPTLVEAYQPLTDASLVAAEGFSDGASYALSLGLLNGDLFSHVIAFSPGFVLAEHRRGRPRCFVSHGTHDQVLPIERCSRRIVRELRDDRYDVSYTEFEGGHAVPSEIARAAAEWLLAPG